MKIAVTATGLLLVASGLGHAGAITLAFEHSDPTQGYTLTVSREAGQSQATVRPGECAEFSPGAARDGWKTYCIDLACPEEGTISYILQAGGLSEPSNVLSAHIGPQCEWTPLEEWRPEPSPIAEAEEPRPQAAGPVAETQQPSQGKEEGPQTTGGAERTPVARETETPPDIQEVTYREPEETPDTTEEATQEIEEETPESATDALERRIAQLEAQLERVQRYQHFWFRKLARFMRWHSADDEEGALQAQVEVFQTIRESIRRKTQRNF